MCPRAARTWAAALSAMPSCVCGRCWSFAGISMSRRASKPCSANRPWSMRGQKVSSGIWTRSGTNEFQAASLVPVDPCPFRHTSSLRYRVRQHFSAPAVGGSQLPLPFFSFVTAPDAPDTHAFQYPQGPARGHTQVAVRAKQDNELLSPARLLPRSCLNRQPGWRRREVSRGAVEGTAPRPFILPQHVSTAYQSDAWITCPC